MNLINMIALAGFAIAAVQAAANFKATCNTANNQMNSLRTYIGQVKAIADKNGHSAISAKCNEATNHLNVARDSWNSISNNFGNFPWEARSSSHGGQCQNRLRSCGDAIDWIYNRPEISRCSDYRVPLNNCRGGHRSCQSTCGQVWNWPSPPGYHPKPSGYFSHYRRDEAKAQCPNANETACPIAPKSTSFECINTQTEIYSCGGCASNNEGENCYTIAGADEFGCEAGVCRVFTALPGFEINPSTGRPVSIKSA